jgi:hypothetical protein
MGLNEDLRHAVEMHLLDPVSQPATLAAIQEHLYDRHRPHFEK